MTRSTALLAATLAASACGDAPPSDPAGNDTDDAGPIEVVVDASSFDCLLALTPVRGFYVDNLLGDLEATLAFATADAPGRWPVGSLIQLVPTEAMVKREAGFSPASNDWEFFALSVADGITTITDRGVEDVVNAFGGNCFSCHAAAEPERDFVCEDDHGCVSLPLTDAAIAGIVGADPRCAGAAD